MLTFTLKSLWSHRRRLAGTFLAVLLGVAFLSLRQRVAGDPAPRAGRRPGRRPPLPTARAPAACSVAYREVVMVQLNDLHSLA
jgi:hypothetical protein